MCFFIISFSFSFFLRPFRWPWSLVFVCSQHSCVLLLFNNLTLYIPLDWRLRLEMSHLRQFNDFFHSVDCLRFLFSLCTGFTFFYLSVVLPAHYDVYVCHPVMFENLYERSERIPSWPNNFKGPSQHIPWGAEENSDRFESLLQATPPRF